MYLIWNSFFCILEYLKLKSSPMKALISGVIAILITTFATAQKAPIKFGDIPIDDLKMTIYDKDSSAAAVVLADYGEAYITVGNAVKLTFERHVRIKILSKDGLKWADGSIPLYHSGSAEETVSGLKAVSYNLENGKIVETKMSKDAVFKEKFNRVFNVQKFSIPNVKEGSVIEYSYRVNSDFYTNFPNWQFQYTIPTRHSEYWAMFPDFFHYEQYMQGYVAVTSYDVALKNMTGYQAKAHHWIMKNIPAFKEEPYMTSEGDYLSKMNFALAYVNFPGQPVQEIMGTWDKLVVELLESEDFGKTIRNSNFLKSTVEKITAGITDPIQKITAIHNYVKENIVWDEYKDFSAGNLKKVMEEKKGTSGDINLLLASMLEKAEFKVEMILLSTRDHGFIRKTSPMAKQFNYTVCAVRLADRTILLDATEKYLPINVLPERCLNGEGLVVSKENFGWVSLETKTKAKTFVMAELTLDEAGDLNGTLNFQRDGYDANRMRKDFVSKGQESYLKSFLESKSWEVKKSDFQNIQDIDKSAKEIHDLTIREHATVAGDVIYINPFVTQQLVSNPFSLEKREYPVDFGTAVEKVYVCKINIPEGYIIDELPQSRLMMLPGNAARYAYNVAVNGNVVSLTSSFQINKSIFIQTEYQNLREFYAQVVGKQAEQIVFKKK
jgi:hypothetical protein